MAEQLTREQIGKAAVIHAQPPVQTRNAAVDRTFQLPRALYGATVGLYLGFIALMAVGFANPGLVIPLVICTLIIVAGFGVPTIWTRLNPQTRAKAQRWGQFQQDGIITVSGRTSARDATVQVLILPVLIFIWGVITVVIAALV